MASFRPAAVSGRFYPAKAEVLSVLLDDCVDSSFLGPQGASESERSFVAGIAPLE